MYLGGREKNKHQSKRTAAFAVPDTKAATLRTYIAQFVADNANIFTDESACYHGLEEACYKHDIVNHSIAEYTKGCVTTNTIEGFWGHFKRMVFGTYHFVSKAYLQPYIDEAVYRYNTRKASESERFSDMFAKSIGVCDYKAVKALKVA